jgi:hypothetical protein
MPEDKPRPKTTRAQKQPAPQDKPCFNDKPREIRNSAIHPPQRDRNTMNLLIRLILIPAGIIASWFVAKDAPNFGAVQTMVAIFLLVFVLLVFGLTSRSRDRQSGS